MTLLPAKLKAAGYEGHMIGKGHLGYQTTDHLPVNRGFQTHLGYLEAAEHYCEPFPVSPAAAARELTRKRTAMIRPRAAGGLRHPPVRWSSGRQAALCGEPRPGTEVLPTKPRPAFLVGSQPKIDWW